MGKPQAGRRGPALPPVRPRGVPGVRTMALACGLLLAGFAVPALAVGLGLGDLRAIRQACDSDIKAQCGTVARGGGRVGQCLLQHVDALSAPCAELLRQDQDKVLAARAGKPPLDTD